MPSDYDSDGELRECTISALVNDDGTVKRGRIIGNAKSCTRYDDALNDHFPSYPNGRWVNRSYIRRAGSTD